MDLKILLDITVRERVNHVRRQLRLVGIKCHANQTASLDGRDVEPFFKPLQHLLLVFGVDG